MQGNVVCINYINLLCPALCECLTNKHTTQTCDISSLSILTSWYQGTRTGVPLTVYPWYLQGLYRDFPQGYVGRGTSNYPLMILNDNHIAISSHIPIAELAGQKCHASQTWNMDPLRWTNLSRLELMSDPCSLQFIECLVMSDSSDTQIVLRKSSQLCSISSALSNISWNWCSQLLRFWNMILIKPKWKCMQPLALPAQYL